MATAAATSEIAPQAGPPDREAYLQELRDSAAEYLEAGLVVTVAEGKNPGFAMGRGWQDHRLNLPAVAALLLKPKLPAIGIQLGPKAGVVDFDIDGPSELRAFVDLFDAAPLVLPQYTSGREGGEHRLAAFDERLQEIGRATVKYTTEDGDEVTVRIGCADKGAHSVVPPSLHVSGKRYAWKPDLSIGDVGLPKLPDAVIGKLLEAGRAQAPAAVEIPPGTPRPPTSRVVASMVRATRSMQDNGDGSKRLFVCCCRAAEFGLNEEATIAAVREYEAAHPFPSSYSDQQILDRLADAVQRSDVAVGSGLGGGLGVKRELTDLGNAERFVARYGDRVRFVSKWARWLVWTGGKWSPNETGEVERLAKEAVRSIYEECKFAADDDEVKSIVAHAKASQSRTRLESMLKLAQSELPVPIMHESLDAEPWLLNCENCTVDLRTGKPLPHDAGHLLTKSTGNEYPSEPGEDAPLWCEFLETTFGGDHDLVRFVQRYFGMSLVGEQSEHTLAILHGGGANGKSVLVNTLHHALGDYAMIAPPGLLMTSRSDRHPTELADLFGKRLVVLSETTDGQRLNEGLVKGTTGGDRIRARRMREDHWEFTPSHTPIVVTNHKPVVAGDDFGIWRRLRLVPFTVTIPPEKQDRRLPEKLKEETPGILRWLVEGCLAWQRGGLQEPPAVVAATGDYRSESDTIARWMQEDAVLTPNAQTKASILFKRYTEWCEESGESPLSQRRFGERLAVNLEKKTTNRGVFYYGIGLAAKEPVNL